MWGALDGGGNATGDGGIVVSLDRGKDTANLGACVTVVKKVHNIPPAYSPRVVPNLVLRMRCELLTTAL